MNKELTEKELCKYFGHLENHQYKHYNIALDCWVQGKEHFKYLMRKGNYIPYEMALGMVKEKTSKSYTLSKEAEGFVRSVRQMADSKGNVRLGSVAINKMKELGVNFGKVERELDCSKGGFYAS